MSVGKTIRVLVADDSVFMRVLIKDILESDASIEVVAQAKDGNEAAHMAKEHDPDVVLMDIIMGQYDGVYGVQEIMKNSPRPIVLLSSIGNTDMNPILDALKLGAVDYLNKPINNSTDIRGVGDELIKRVKEAANLKLDNIKVEKVCINVNPHTFSDNLNYDVIVIGSSTGGPTAVEKVITTLPGNLTVPVIIAQHMPSNFVPSFANRLNLLTPLEVAIARKDDVLEKGKILIAPGSRNIIVRKSNDKVVIDYTHERYKHFNFPSVDGIMLSIAEVYGARSIGVILTGMGRDGADGIAAIRDAGGYTVAQSESTCVVYGMPKAAVETGKVNQIVPINEIGIFLVNCL
jgi:two-component system, chemotaxis family, protein-glutamate methylesterase/glutaminase